MPLDVIGQRCVSEREPELGLGVVASFEGAHLGVVFPASGEKRLYKRNTPVLKRVLFHVGDTVSARGGERLVVESVVEEAGLLVYCGGGQRLREDAVSDLASVLLPQARLLAGQAEPGEVFDLRQRALQAQATLRQSPLRGFMGGRIDLIPHQFFILREVAARAVPRVLLADEVGLGKTIEACLIVQRLLAVGRAKRVLVLVPESLVHQWFVELLRRFNLWFSILDEQRCLAAEPGAPEGNPFLGQQLALCSLAFLAGDEARGAQAVSAGWDIVVVDEAHHLEWAPGAPSPEYTLVEHLSFRSPGLLLLTATPTQLGLPGHFARLRLLDPNRYADYATFLAETEAFVGVAAVAEHLVEEKPLKARELAALKRIFQRAPEALARHLAALEARTPGAREALLRTLVDQHGPGRVMFRNTRAAMTGFPRRKFCPALLAGADPTLLARCARELEAEEKGGEASIRYSYKDDPRIQWLAGFLRKHSTAKVLLICRSQRKVAAIAAAMQETINVKTGLFHEGLPLVQRDRQAAWFAEPDGARLLICSEIGSEGRNFQFAHHLVLFDLPLNPALVEQRIGRLDRIGQTQAIQIHAPCLGGSAEECVVEWYQRGLGAFESPMHGGAEYVKEFRERLLVLALGFHSAAAAGRNRAALDTLVAETAQFRRSLQRRLQQGRDRLLELASFDRAVAERLVEEVRAADADPMIRRLLPDLLDHYGVQMKEHEGRDLFLDPSHAYVEAFPSIPAAGMLVTFERSRALVREDIPFVSRDHALVRDSLDLLLNSPSGTTAFALVASGKPNLILESVFVLEAVADSRWHVDQFLPPAPVRVVVDARGQDLTATRPPGPLADETPEHALLRFLERPQFNAALLKSMVDSATAVAEIQSTRLRAAAATCAQASLCAEIQRLIDLRKVNDHVRPEEISLAQDQLRLTGEAIAQARLRLDSLRLIVEGAATLTR
jgi:ATP-dependent helicase HepA